MKEISINNIDSTTVEGRLLLVAIAKITTESQLDKTPDEVLVQIVKLDARVNKQEKEIRGATMSVIQTQDIKLYNPSQAAELIQVSKETLRRWRQRSVGPAYIKLGAGTSAPVRYRKSDLIVFFETFIRECSKTGC